MSDDPINKVEGVSASRGISSIADKAIERVSPDKAAFDAAMVKVDYAQEPAAIKGSLMDEVKGIQQAADRAQSSYDTLASKASLIIGQIDDLKLKLQTPDLEVKKSVQRVLNNKLEYIDQSLKVAMDKAGLEYVPPVAESSSKFAPIDKFLGMLTNGQEQLQGLGKELSVLGAQESNLSPANLIAIQVKVNYIQQELEFFTNVLNKALESTKTIMNVQV